MLPVDAIQNRGPYFATPYRPRQQRANPFSLMNHETRQRHRNTLKGEMHRPRARARAFFCCLLSFFRAQPFNLSIYLRSLSFFFAVAVRLAARPSFLNQRCSYSATPAPVRGNASFLKMILADRARHLFRIPPYLVPL